MTKDDDHKREEASQFEHIRDRAYDLLKGFGQPNFQLKRAPGDYFVHGDYGGYPQVVVFVSNLKMLRPPVIGALQRLVKEFPGWEIEVTVAVPEHYEDWPDMGLYIRPHEIIDGLQRQYLPEEFQSIQYEGARRGGALD